MVDVASAVVTWDHLGSVRIWSAATGERLGSLQQVERTALYAAQHTWMFMDSAGVQLSSG